MAKITDFPVELLEKILLLIPHSVLGCTRVCRKFNPIANRVLYHDVDLAKVSPWRSTTRLNAFLLVIIDQPELGKYVKFLSVTFYYPDRSRFDISPVFVTEAASRGLSQEIQQAIQNGSTEAITFLLFFYLPALRRLYIITRSSGSILSKQIRDVKPLPSGLQSVRSVTLETYYGWDLVRPLFNLPAVDTISWNMGHHPFNSLDTDLFPSNVKHIKLSSLHSRRLDKLVRSSPSLQTFSFKYHEEIPNDGLLPALGNAFRDCVSATLQCLELRSPLNREYKESLSLGSLRDLTTAAMLLHAVSMTHSLNHSSP